MTNDQLMPDFVDALERKLRIKASVAGGGLPHRRTQTKSRGPVGRRRWLLAGAFALLITGTALAATQPWHFGVSETGSRVPAPLLSQTTSVLDRLGIQVDADQTRLATSAGADPELIVAVGKNAAGGSVSCLLRRVDGRPGGLACNTLDADRQMSAPVLLGGRATTGRWLISGLATDGFTEFSVTLSDGRVIPLAFTNNVVSGQFDSRPVKVSFRRPNGEQEVTGLSGE